MKKLNIDWLHNPHKSGRRSGKTTDMLADVVGIAQLSHETSHVMVVCGDCMLMMSNFIDVLRSIDQSAKYGRTICMGFPSVAVMSEYGQLCYVMFSNKNFEHWANGLRSAYQVVDHHFYDIACAENKRMEMRRKIYSLGHIRW